MIRVDLGKRQCVAAMWAILVAALAPSVCGQAVAVAEVDGQVADPSGATVSGAEVKITQSQTKFSRIVMTDAQGNFRLLELPVGPCVLEVKAEGFKTYMRSGIILQVGAAIQLNVSLTLGSVNESVEVNASASMVEAKSNAVAQVIDERRINDLPLNGRQPTQLIMISGAAMPSVAGNHFASSKNYNSSTAISVAGGQGNYTNYLLDGGDNNDTFTNVNLPFPFPDALQEFSVETSSLPAVSYTHLTLPTIYSV